MAHCLIGLGANLGERQRTLDRALAALAADPHIRVVAKSSWYRTAAIGGPSGQGEFLNGAAVLETSLGPEALLDRLLSIETQLGRQRGVRWDARTLDLDLLLYEELRVATPRLSVPHPRMAFRRFVLDPAAEIAADMIHPHIGWSVGQLLHHLEHSRPYVAISGPAGAGKTRLAGDVSAAIGGEILHDPASSERFEAAMSAGSGLESAIQFCKARADALASSGWPSGGATVVSDFWLSQTDAYAKARLSEQDYAIFGQTFSEAAAEAVTPRLLVLLGVPDIGRSRGGADEEHLGGKTLGDSILDDSELLRREWSRIATRPGIGPLLILAPGNKPEQESVELTAAIQAMG